MKEFWNKRYAATEFAYGETPNQFFKESIEQIDIKGRILLPAEGEGRNAIYAAKKGLSVYAFDISKQGQNKALAFAKQENVQIKYDVGNFMDLDLKANSFDIAALIFAHFPPHLIRDYHRKIGELIKPNGFLILEGFSKKHLTLKQKDPKIGGPNNIDMLFSIEDIQRDFSDFEVQQLQEVTVNLTEGAFHNGNSSVIRFIGKKK